VRRRGIAGAGDGVRIGAADGPAAASGPSAARIACSRGGLVGARGRERRGARGMGGNVALAFARLVIAPGAGIAVNHAPGRASG